MKNRGTSYNFLRTPKQYFANTEHDNIENSVFAWMF